MNGQERQVIQDLFAKLADIERQGAPREPEAEEFIRQRVAAQPAAPYYMAQTIVTLEKALKAAQQRMAELEQQPARGRGSLSSAPLGDRGRTRGPWGKRSMDRPGYAGPGHGGGFLAGAAQTALGVAGGVLLGSLIADAFSADPASAADQPDTTDHTDPADQGAENQGYDPAESGDTDFGNEI